LSPAAHTGLGADDQRIPQLRLIARGGAVPALAIGIIVVAVNALADALASTGERVREYL